MPISFRPILIWYDIKKPIFGYRPKFEFQYKNS